MSMYNNSGPTALIPPTAANVGGPIGTATNNTIATTSHAVSRSTELLSCARTALKILKAEYQQHHRNNNKQPPWWMSVEPSRLQLHQLLSTESHVSSLLEDGISLLRTMEQGLVKLEGLVRRRGHVNDPTNEIAVQVKNLEADAKELAHVVQSLQTLPQRKSTQHGRHLERVAQWLEGVASQQTQRLKNVLKVRGNVLADQAQRRKLLNPRGSSSSSNAPKQRNGTMLSSTATPTNGSNGTPWDSPLFTMTSSSSSTAVPRPNATRSEEAPTTIKSATAKQKPAPRSHGSTPPLYGSSAATSSGYYGNSTAGYGGYGYGGAGYGGATTNTGMRQRKTTAASQSNNNNNDQDDMASVQAQIQLREQDRQTRQRLESARQAERSLADLGQLFGKMSTLIHSQGETLEKIEDDVERAAVDVEAGHEEINTLHALKKGNRALILKVFGILIFFIIFMRLY